LKEMVYFVGAGAGDPELITVKGQRLLQKADAVVWAGSLVNPVLLENCKPAVKVFDSAKMTLQETTQALAECQQAGGLAVRLHTGDPSLYGAIAEQMRELDKLGISYQVVPGVSSFVAAAAALQAEFTLPGITQTVILTRAAGRTPVPESEDIEKLAAIGASMAIFLSVHMLDDVTAKLMKYYPADTPAAVVEKASWPDQRIIRGTLSDIASKIKEAGVTKTAQVLVGRFIDGVGEKSLLYDPGFTHGYRQASE
jgi:precorrin-4/cobalt-precorrin-4 C11-methyltransferase